MGGGIFSDSIITNFLLILIEKKSLKIGQYLMSCKAYKKCANFLGATLYILFVQVARIFSFL